MTRVIGVVPAKFFAAVAFAVRVRDTGGPSVPWPVLYQGRCRERPRLPRNELMASLMR